MLIAGAARADGPLGNVNHIIVIMQENHSFDNYLGGLPYVAGGPYHSGPCFTTDNTCVDGLSCTRDISGNYTCTNSNQEADGSTVFAFHDLNYCPAPDLDHEWLGSHQEGNFLSPNNTASSSPNDGFVRVNDADEQIDTGESPTEDDTMGFYNESDLALYYFLAQTFAIDDCYFTDILGPTIPNRFYFMAATSFGHLSSDEAQPPPGGYQPITGTIFQRLEAANTNWVDFYSDAPQEGYFANQSEASHFVPIASFYTMAAQGTLPPVSFIDSVKNGTGESDGHPPSDIRADQYFVWPAERRRFLVTR